MFFPPGESALRASSLTLGEASALVNPSLSLPSLPLSRRRCFVLVFRLNGSSLVPEELDSASWTRCLVRVERLGCSAGSAVFSRFLCFVRVERTGSVSIVSGSGFLCLVRVDLEGLAVSVSMGSVSIVSGSRFLCFVRVDLEGLAGFWSKGSGSTVSGSGLRCLVRVERESLEVSWNHLNIFKHHRVDKSSNGTKMKFN